jgi:hypothetical protein
METPGQGVGPSGEEGCSGQVKGPEDVREWGAGAGELRVGVGVGVGVRGGGGAGGNGACTYRGVRSMSRASPGGIDHA